VWRVVKAAPDGYTLLLVNSPNAINATLYDKLNFNFIRDIAPVARIVRVPYVMVVNPSFPANTVPEFISYRHRNHGPFIRRAIQVDGRRQHDPRALSWVGAHADGYNRRSGAGYDSDFGRVGLCPALEIVWQPVLHPAFAQSIVPRVDGEGRTRETRCYRGSGEC